MDNLIEFLKNLKNKKMLLIFPHPDDEAYVSGGLLQVAQELSIHTKLICLTKGGRGLLPKNRIKAKLIKDIRIKELERACEILGVDEKTVWDYPDGGLYSEVNKWLPELKKEIDKFEPSILVTFDPSGITGHPDHLVVNHKVTEYIFSLDKRPILFLRVPDKQEYGFFKNNKQLSIASKPTHELNYSFKISINKIKAILAHKSQIKSLFFKLHIFEWLLFDHKELYHLVDYDNEKHIQFDFVKC